MTLGFSFANAESGTSALLSSVLGSASQKTACISGLKDLSEFRLLFALPEYQTFVSRGETKALRESLKTWSSDLLLRIYSQIESEFLFLCPEATPMERTKLFLGRLYLSSLGIAAEKMEASEVKVLVHGLVMLKEDLPVVISKIKKVKSHGMPLLKKLYGHAETVLDVVVVSEKKIPSKEIQSFLKEICDPAQKTCLFWHSSSLWKVVLTEERGVASYVPEIRTLVLSQELVTEPNLLMKVVVLHELAHVADAAAWNLLREKWSESFSRFSGWKKVNQRWLLEAKKFPPVHQDLLTELSKGAHYSILPDDTYVPGKEEGFVFGKSYLDSLKRDDPSEDFADSVAAFHFAPQRFCPKGKLALSQKANWIRAHLYPSATLPLCTQ